MRQARFEENQKNIIETLTLMRNNNITECSDSLEVIKSITEFDEEETKLLDRKYRQTKKIQLKQIGGKDTRTAIWLALDAMMTRTVQDQFSKDGLKGKRAFSKTQDYKCFIGALLDSTKHKYNKDRIDYHIGDVLKRAIRNKTKHPEQQPDE